MLTIHEARERLEAYFAQHPPAMSGELYISDDWNEDDSDYLPAWGAREFFVEHRQSFVRMDNLALFIDKQTGGIRRANHVAEFDKIQAMRPVSARVDADAAD